MNPITLTPKSRTARQPWAIRTVVVRLSRKLTATYRIRSGHLLSRLLVAVLAGFTNLAVALPTGGDVVAGQASVSTPTPHQMRVQQGSDKAIINWQSFSIGAGQSVQFVQPGAASVALNRVTGANPSAIYGSLSANGQVFLVNPAGVMFAPGAQVNVGGLVASSLAIGNDDFLAGRYTFSGTGGGGVVNHGSINVARTGYVLLAGASVSNTGTIVTEAGATGLLAGSRVTLDTSGAGLVRFSVDAAAVNAAASNSGTITAAGGQVAMLASALGDAMATVVNQSGVIRATSATERNGMVVLSGGRSGVVHVAGTLDASGAVAGQSGGTVQVLGDKLLLATGARIDVSGQAGGGTVLVGGDYQGSNSAVPNAARTHVAAGSTIRADALEQGHGGKVVIWADGDTRSAGSISARGGTQGGDGGFVEVSGKQYLDTRGTIDVTAPQGVGGKVLFDPQDIILSTAASNPSVVSNQPVNTPDLAFAAAPDPGTYTVQISTVTGFNELFLQATRDISVNNPLSMAANGSVRLEANNNIAVATGATIAVTGTGSIHLKSDADSSGAGTLSLAAGLSSQAGGITLSGANVTSTAAGTVTTTGAANGDGGAVSITGTGVVNLGGAITATGGTAGAGTAGRAGGAVSITGVGGVTTAAITANGSAGNGAGQAGGNAGSISVSNSGTGNIQTGALTASTGNAAGTGLGGTAGSISVSNTATAGNVTTGALTTTGGTFGHGGSVTLSALGTAASGNINTTGGTTLTGNAGRNAGAVSITGAGVNLGASTITANGSAGLGTSQSGGNGASVSITSTNGVSQTGAITASGAAGSTTAGAGGNAGSITVSNTTAGAVSLGALAAQTGAAVGSGAGGTAGAISVSNAAGNLTTGTLTTTGGLNGNGGSITVAAANGTVVTGNVAASGGAAGGTSNGRNAGSISISGAALSLGASTITANGTTASTLGTGGNGGAITLSSSGAISSSAAISATGGNGAGANQGGGNGAAVSVSSTGGNVAVASITTTGGNGVAGTAAGGNAGAITLDAAGGTPTVTLAGNLTALGGNQVGGGTSGSGGTINIKRNALLNAATVTLDSRGGNAGVGTGGNVQLDGAVNSTGGARALSVTAGTGDVTLTGAAGATSALSGLTVTGNDITVANIGGAAAGVTGATTLTATTAGADTGEISLNGALNVNTLALTTAASITQTNALTATSLTATLTGATSALTLSNSGNQITTLNAVTTPGGFTLNNGNNNVTVAGNITATNNAVAIDAGTGSYTQNNNIDVTAGSGPITVTADTVTIGTTNAGGNALATSGVLTIKAKTAARAMSLAGASGFDIAANEILAFATGATGPIVIGDTSSTGVMTIGGAIGLAGKTLTLNAGSITDTGTQTISATNVTLNANGQIGTSSANGIDIAATNLNVNTTGNASAFVRTGAINLGVGTSGSNLGTGTLDLTATGAVTQTATTGNVTAGTLQVKTLANAGAAITLTNSGNNVSAVNLQSRNLADGLNAAGAIQYTDTNGFDVAAVATTGNATLSAGGTVTQSGAISASGLALTGTGGNQTLRHASNAVTTLAANTGSIDYSQAGALTVGTVGGVVGVTTAVAAKIETTGAASDLTLTNAVTSNGTGDAIVLKAGSSNSAGTSTGGKLVNSAGASGIVASAGRYLVYSGDPGTTTEGVTGGYSKRYNTSASFTPGGSANMFLYRIAPTLTISSNNASKIYGQVNPVFTGNSSGYIDGDTAASVGVTRTSAAVFNTPVAQSGIAITSGATNNENYTLVLSHGALEIKRASISSVSGITANNKVVDGNTSATLNTGAPGYAGLVAGDVLSVATANGNFDTPFVGGNKTVFVTGITLGGAAADNYDLLDKTATTRASITDLSGVPGALIFAPPPTPVFRARTAGLSVADANALLESTPTASGGCGASGAAEGCLSVSALREATDQAPGLVSVTVAGNGAGFQFSLPSGVLAGAADSTVPVEVATLGGRPLPDWLRFDADKQVFVASTPPPGALPLQIRVSRGERSAIVTITEAQAGTPASRGVVVQRQTDSPARTPG